MFSAIDSISNYTQLLKYCWIQDLQICVVTVFKKGTELDIHPWELPENNSTFCNEENGQVKAMNIQLWLNFFKTLHILLSNITVL